ncbi:MAG: aminoacetone oxidase family FAD-binding enzyme, partial [Clostridia bacterium]|nr:aminoacetone oxidase family FAD-binding enzyme [Clostridia bacterium]
MIYDTIVIGGGASGLFYSASDSAPGNKLILEKGKHFGQKLLLSAQGQCNITHAGSIKDFIDFYGDKGKTIRSILYKHSNLELMEFIESRGLKLQTRAGGKVFPRSMSAKDVLKVLLDATKENGYEMKTLCQVSSIDPESKTVIVESQGNEYTYSYKKLIIATGGATYPMTGSDGNFADVLCKDLGVDNIDFRPALVPLKVDKYPYGELTGVSIDKALCSIGKNQVQGPLLFTHKDLSGPS